jgi:hypothetical protein
LAGTQPIAHLAQQHDVRRKFVYQRADQAEHARADAFAPQPPSADAVLFYLPVTERWLKRLLLALLLLCHSSYRGVYERLRDVLHCPRALGYLPSVAHAAMDRARAANACQDLSAVRIGAHDEIFQATQPVLVGVAVDSTYCYLLSLETQRDGVTWGVRLLDLQVHGFAPQALSGDAGSGLAAGQELALPDVPRRGDVFHVLPEVGPLVTALENRAYQALQASVKLERQQAESERQKGRRDGRVGQKRRHARPAAAAAVALADDGATLADWLRRDILALAGPTHADRVTRYDLVVAELRTRAPLCPHRLNPGITSLVNQRAAVLAFAEERDADLGTVAADFGVAVDVARAVLQVQELDARDRRRWPAEAALRAQLGGRFYGVNAAVAAVARATVRARSVVENRNSRLRNYFFLRRHLGPDYLQLLQFFLNQRRFLRSAHAERVDKSPAELLTGQAHAHWLELLGLPDPLDN